MILIAYKAVNIDSYQVSLNYKDTLPKNQAYKVLEAPHFLKCKTGFQSPIYNKSDGGVSTIPSGISWGI